MLHVPEVVVLVAELLPIVCTPFRGQAFVDRSWSAFSRCLVVHVFRELGPPRRERRMSWGIYGNFGR